MGVGFIQFIPLVEPRLDSTVSSEGSLSDAEARDPSDMVTERSIGPEQYGAFLIGIFDHWLAEEDIGKIFVRGFDVELGIVAGYPPALCVNGETCGRSVAIEHDGQVFSCDHFVTPRDRIGGIFETDLAAMLDGGQQTKFGDDKRDALPRYCRECEFLRVCNGGCPKDRIATTPDGEPGLNYLCAGYKLYYAHALPVLAQMAKCLHHQRPASDYKVIDSLIAREQSGQHPGAPLRRTRPMAAPDARPAAEPGAAPRGKIGRNAPCPCGSGKKYKRCCGRTAAKR